MTDKILQGLGMPPERSERIVLAVKNHLFHLSWNLTAPEQASPRHRRFIADPRFPLLLELLRVDSIASEGNPRGMDGYNLYKTLFEKIVDSEQGNDLINLTWTVSSRLNHLFYFLFNGSPLNGPCCKKVHCFLA